MKRISDPHQHRPSSVILFAMRKWRIESFKLEEEVVFLDLQDVEEKIESSPQTEPIRIWGGGTNRWKGPLVGWFNTAVRHNLVCSICNSLHLWICKCILQELAILTPLFNILDYLLRTRGACHEKLIHENIINPLPARVYRIRITFSNWKYEWRNLGFYII